MSISKFGLLGAAGITALGLVACGSGTPTAATTPSTTVSAQATGTPAVVTPAPTAAPTAIPTPAPTAAPTAVPTPAVTTGEANAAAAAASYLATMGFSRAGLIRQLSSSAEGYSVADATYGVDAQHADWNAEAAQSAKDYLQTMPFSCQGLVQQLSSSAEGYTLAQAQYGAHAAGVC